MATIWCNGQWREDDQLLMAALDRGVLHGLGLFETMLAIDGVPRHWDLHRERLQSSAKRLGWSLPDFPFEDAMAELLERNGFTRGHARLRLTLSAGSGSMRDLEAADDRVCWLSASLLTPAPDALRVAVCPWRRNEHSPLAGLKCASYAENLVALDWARRQGLDELLFLNTAGQLCEAATANVFVVREGVLRTPPAESGCLAGVMRAMVLQWAPALGIPVEECRLGMEDVGSASELMLTNAVHGVMPVVRVGELSFAEGPVTGRLRDGWRQSLTAR